MCLVEHRNIYIISKKLIVIYIFTLFIFKKIYPVFCRKPTINIIQTCEYRTLLKQFQKVRVNTMGEDEYNHLRPKILCIYQFIVYDIRYLVADVVHLPYPLHLILCFELFGYTFLFGKLLHKSVEHFIRFFVNISEMSGEGTTG